MINEPSISLAVSADSPPAGRFQKFLPLLLNRGLVFGGATLIVLVAIAVAAPWVAPHSPLHTDVMATLQPPSLKYLLGTDQFGRCILSRLIWGSRVSLEVALSVVLLSLSIGTLLGAVAGYAGGWKIGRASCRERGCQSV